MSEFKVERADSEEKSIQEIEQELNKEEEVAEEVVEEKIEEVVEKEIVQLEIKDEDVLSHIKTRYGKEINSIDELFQEREEKEDLPEEVKMYLKYNKETGRGYDDFKNLNKDFDKEDPTNLVAEYYRQQNPDFDAEDISMEMDAFRIDEDMDEDHEIKVKKLAFKKELKKAKDYFNGKKEQYKVPLESRVALVPDNEKEAYESYKQYKTTLDETQAKENEKSQYFTDKTNALFNESFEGFEVKVGEQTIKYKPSDATTLREKQSKGLKDFIGRYLDDEGKLKDAAAFHRDIAIAMDVDKYTKFIYEKARADEAEMQSKNSKNIDMTRTPNQQAPVQGFKVELDNSEDNGSRQKMKKRH